MKETKLEIPDGCEVDKIETQDGHIVVTFREKERKLPKSWEEFCEMYNVSDTEYFIDDVGGICNAIENKAFTSRDRENDKNVLPDRATADAILALRQLIQLRNAYNGDWVPDWKDLTEQKFAIEFTTLYDDYITKKIIYQHASLLYFKSQELCDEFLRCFRTLIEQLKPLYGIKEGGEE